QPALLHRSAGQRRESNDVSGCIDVRHRGLIVVVHIKLTAAVICQTCCLKVQLIAVGLPSDGVQQSLAMNVLSALQFCEDAVALFVVSNRNHLFAKTKHSAQLPQLKAQALDDLPVDEV